MRALRGIEATFGLVGGDTKAVHGVDTRIDTSGAQNDVREMFSVPLDGSASVSVVKGAARTTYEDVAFDDVAIYWLQSAAEAASRKCSSFIVRASTSSLRRSSGSWPRALMACHGGTRGHAGTWAPSGLCTALRKTAAERRLRVGANPARRRAACFDES